MSFSGARIVRLQASYNTGVTVGNLYLLLCAHPVAVVFVLMSLQHDILLFTHHAPVGLPDLLDIILSFVFNLSHVEDVAFDVVTEDDFGPGIVAGELFELRSLQVQIILRYFQQLLFLISQHQLVSRKLIKSYVIHIVGREWLFLSLM